MRLPRIPRSAGNHSSPQRRNGRKEGRKIGRGMICRLFFAVVSLCFLCLCGVGSSFAADKDQGHPPDVVRIGVVNSFFRDVPEPLVRPLIEPFRALMMAETGVKSEVVPTQDALQLAQDLAEGKLHIVLFHGFEFAWAKQAFPDLRPLMIAIHQRPDMRACLVAPADSPIRSVADLKSKSLALPRFTQEHCWLYMERACKEAGQAEAKKFFSPLSYPRDAEVALDDVADGKIQAAIVDNIALESYRQRKPARFNKVKLVQESEIFPAAVIAYRTGTLDTATVKRFQESLLRGQHSSLGRQLLTLWKITSLQVVPADFDKTLEKTLKAYPAPEKQDAKKIPAEARPLARRAAD
jgi:ABC-type phosphate/phosphonate transport system substrate-binding protein